ncbi:hypothetical protein SynNOUM97013_01938 [Synechococcus sp. NOUM97013]|nr:hypothetical protein SynNOUM97013_01938 [Synechococcus sp. NOUM97013]
MLALDRRLQHLWPVVASLIFAGRALNLRTQLKPHPLGLATSDERTTTSRYQ